MADAEQSHQSGPNICGLRLNGSEGWLRHPISNGDTMTRLALKYDTSIGLICRANRMHGQDVLQTRHHIWVPMPLLQLQMFPVEMQLLPQPPPALAHAESLSTPSSSRSPAPLPSGGSYSVPPHFYRQSVPNPNYLTKESDPLLITSKIMRSS